MADIENNTSFELDQADENSLNSVSRSYPDGAGGFVRDFTSNNLWESHATREIQRESLSTQDELPEEELYAQPEESEDEPTEEEGDKYTAAEAATYNAALPGAVKAGDAKEDTEVESDSYDYIHDEASWNASYENGGLKKYYIWSDAANAPYKEDLIYTDPDTGETRPASLNDAKKDPETGEYLLDDNGNYIYENCGRSWAGAFAAPGAKYPWIVLNFDTDVNSTVKLQYEGKADVTPWGDAVFGIGRKPDGSDRLFGCASVPTGFGEEFLEDAEGNTSFDPSKFKVILVKQEVAVYTEEEAEAYNAALPGAVKEGDNK